MTTIHISNKTHKKLQKIKGKLMASNGEERSFDAVILELITCWNQQKQTFPDEFPKEKQFP